MIQWWKRAPSRLALMATLIFMLGITDRVCAQTPGRVVEAEGGMVVWLVALGLIALVCLTGFLSSKRSHMN